MTHHVDARWIMAYAAGLGDRNPCYLDTAANTSVVAHPVFPVCLEWPVILDCRHLPGSESVTPEEGARGVHASHDLHIHRPIRAGETLTTTATSIGLAAKKPGACQTTRLDTRDASGALVCQTYQLGISRGVAVLGEASAETPPPLPDMTGLSPGDLRVEIPVAAEAAHVYTECARIWNPIHTDRAVALAAGLPDIILHGTATLALAVSALVDRCLNGVPTKVRRLGCRFSAMVLMPSTITLAVTGQAANRIAFEVLTEDGKRAVSHGFLVFED
jgi:acyl dehydratase